MITGTDEGTTGHQFESQCPHLIAHFIEFFRRQETLNRQVLRRRLQVLTDGHNVTANGPQIGTKVALKKGGPTEIFCPVSVSSTRG